MNKSLHNSPQTCLLKACLLFALFFVQASAMAQSDPSLVQALQQETYDPATNKTDMESLMWLSAMSAKLERRIPNPFYRVRLLSSAYREARAEGLDPQLVLAVIDIESNFNRNALSHAGAQGLMQVMPFWKKEIGEESDDLYNPITSLRYGCKILRHYLDIYPNAVEALAAYNGSHGRTVYPDKVFGRLKRQWQFKSDQYAGSLHGTNGLAIEENPRKSSNSNSAY